MSFVLQALQDYSIVLLLDSSLELKACINRGLLYFAMGDFENALHDFCSARDLDVRNKKIYHTLGLCLHK